MIKHFLLVAVIFLAVGGTAKAEPLTDTTNTSILEQLKPKEEKPKPKIVKYTVKENDTLNSIAKRYHTTSKRLFYKNLNIAHPDIIITGQRLTIPSKGEKLKKRNVKVDELNLSDLQGQGVKVENSSGKLIGSIGYATCGGNCVNEPGVNNPFDGTNPISWAVLTQTPTIGATALWNYNHTGVVVGIWEGGQYIEVRHQNFCGGQHKFHISEFRGFR